MLRLRFERQNKRLSQTAVGRIAGLPQYVVSFIEIGRVVPSAEELERLSKVFGVPPEDLMKDVAVLGPSR